MNKSANTCRIIGWIAFFLFFSIKTTAQVNHNLDTVVVLPQSFQQVFFGSPTEDIIGYAFVNKGFLLALTNYQTRSSYLLLLSKSGKVLFKQDIPFDPKTLYTSCINRYYLCYKKSVHEIVLSNQGIQTKEISANYFYKTIQYYIAYKKPYFYFTGFSLDQLMQGFFIENTDTKDLGKTPFTVVPRLQEMKDLRASEKRRVANQKNNWQLPGMMGPTIAGETDPYYLDNTRSFMEAAYQAINFEAVWSPLFVCDSVVVLVNYPQNLIEHYQLNSTFIDTIPLALASPPNPPQYTLFDAVTNRIFCISSSKDLSYNLFEINHRLGTFKLQKTLAKGNKTQFALRDNYIYYLAQTADSKVNAPLFLFREPLNSLAK